MHSYFTPIVIAEWVAFIAALSLLYKATNKWRLFIPWLLLVLAAETVGWYMYIIMHSHHNALPFNFLLLITILFLCLFLSAYATRLVKRITRICLLLFAGFWLVNLIFYQGISNYNNLTEVLGDIIQALLCCHILYLLANGDENTPALGNLDYFWLTTGTLFLSLGSALHYVFQDTLVAYAKATGINIGYYILTVLNIVFYSCIIIAFYCRWKSQSLLSALSSRSS